MLKRIVLCVYISWPILFHAGSSAMAANSPLMIQSNDGDYKLFFNFEYRPRFEFGDNRDFTTNTNQDFISHRARFRLTGEYTDFLEVVFEVQDVRLWGEERSKTGFPADGTLFGYDAEGLDFHQGYVVIEHKNKCFLKLGRQEIPFDTHRIFGDVNWTQQARSFDAARTDYRQDSFTVSGIYAKVREDDTAVQTLSVTVPNPLPPPPPARLTLPVTTGSGVTGLDWDLFILHGSIKPADPLYASLLVVWDGMEAAAYSSRWTVGPYIKLTSGGLHCEAEGYGQFGHIGGGREYLAFMGALRGGYTFDVDWKPTLDAWFDYLSGDDDADNKVEVFNTLFATNHKFYGYMDFFLNIPVDTGGLGLQDVGAMAKIRPHEYLICQLDFHQFFTAKDTPLGNSNLGAEVDFTLKIPLPRHVTLMSGLSAFHRGRAMGDIRGPGLSQWTEWWGYVQADVKI